MCPDTGFVPGSKGRETIKLWDSVSHEGLASLKGNGSFFVNTCFSPDGNTIAARNMNGMLHVCKGSDRNGA